MPSPHSRQALIAASLALACLTIFAFGKKKDQKVATQMPESKRALHALQRLTFGPRPGEVDRVAE